MELIEVKKTYTIKLNDTEFDELLEVLNNAKFNNDKIEKLANNICVELYRIEDQ